MTDVWVSIGAKRWDYPETWNDTTRISDAELWETHVTLKTRLLDFVRRRAAAEAELRGEDPSICLQLRRALSPDALTIGFARRFATYKRAGLIFEDENRLLDLVNNPKRPIQFVLAGKAHPKDFPGKELIQKVFRLSRDPRFLGKIVMVEDYDINVGRHLVQGVDVWLNNPRRPLEASGTSGQKVVLNGGLNLSILDGWWAEAYDGENGFAIGTTATHSRRRNSRPTRSTIAARRAREPSDFNVLRARPGWHSHAMDQADEAGYSHPRLAVQRRSHGRRLFSTSLSGPSRRHVVKVRLKLHCSSAAEGKRRSGLAKSLIAHLLRRMMCW